MSSLKPDETIQKLLISSPCRFVGEFTTEHILLTHAFPNLHGNSSRRYIDEVRTAYIFSFRTPLVRKEVGVVLPDYNPVGSMICSYLSVLYGKRFDSHGLIEGIGIFHTPDLSNYNQLCNHSLPFNSHVPRKNIEIPLNLDEIAKLMPLINGSLSSDMKFIRTIQSASKFYLQALQNFENDAEIAYLHLITTIEIISAFYEYDKSELLDAELRKNLEIIQSASGEKVANFVKNRLYQVKRQFVKTVSNLINDNFFIGSDYNESWQALPKDDFDKRISAAYDLRSKYVHTGVSFGKWVSSRFNTEIMLGKPIVKDRDYEKILCLSPTFVGLERVVRYCLLRFIHLNGVRISPLLD